MAGATGVKIAGTKLVLEGAEDFIQGLKKAAQAQEDFNETISGRVGVTNLADQLDQTTAATARLSDAAKELQKDWGLYAKTPMPQLDPDQWNRLADSMKGLDTLSYEFGTTLERNAAILEAENVAAKEATKANEDLAAALSKVGTAMIALGTASATVLVGFTLVASRIDELSRILEVTVGNAKDLAIEEATLAASHKDVAAKEEALARAAQLTIGAVTKEVEAVRALHIQGIAANEVVAQMIRYSLDWTRASDLAREAQDAATYASQDSSVAMNGLIQGIITLQPRLLRTYGIMINLDIAYEKWATANKHSVKEMTIAERQQAALNEVLAKAPSIAGAYEASMGTASKQLRSLKTDSVNLAEAYGQYLTPALDAVVTGLRKVIKEAINLPDWAKKSATEFAALSTASLLLVGSLGKVYSALSKLTGATDIFVILGRSAKMLGLSLLNPIALLGEMALITAGFIITANNLEDAHQNEAAAILEASDTYPIYIQMIKDAGLESYVLSEGLYEVAKAADEASVKAKGLALEKAKEGLKDTWTEARVLVGDLNSSTLAYNAFVNSIKSSLPTYNDEQLEVLDNAKSLAELADALNLVGDKRRQFLVDMTKFIDAEIEARGVNSDNAARMEERAIIQDRLAQSLRGLGEEERAYNQYIKDLADNTGLSTEEVIRLKDIFKLTDDEVKSFGDSLNLTNMEIITLARSSSISAEAIMQMRDEMSLTEPQIRDLISAFNDLTQAETKRNDALEDLDSDYYDKAIDLNRDKTRELAKIDAELADAHASTLDEMSDLDREYADKRQDAYQDMIDSLADADRQLAQDIADAQRDMQQDLADADRDYAQDREDANRDMLEKLADAERDYQQELEDAARERLQNIDDLEREYAQDLEDAARDRAQEILDTDQKLADDQAELLEDLKRDQLKMEEEYAQDKADLLEDLNKDLEDMERDHAERMAEINKKYQEAQKQANEELKKDLHSTWEDFYQELAEINEKYRVSMGGAPKLSFDERREALERRLRALGTREETKKEREAILEELRKLQAEEIAAARARTNALIAEKKRQYEEEKRERKKQREEELKEDEEDYKRKRKERQDDYKADLEDLLKSLIDKGDERLKEYAQDLQDLIDAHKKLEEEQQADYDRQLEDMKHEHERQHEEIERDYQEKLDDLKRQHDQENEEIRRDYEQKLADLKTQHDREREEIQRDYQQKLADLALQHAQEEAEIQRRYQQKLAELAIQLDRERTDTIAKLEEQRQAVNAKYAEQAEDLALWYQDRLDDIESEYNKQKDKTNKKIEEIVDSAAGEYGNLPEALKPTYEALQTQATDEMEKWKENILTKIKALIEGLNNLLNMGSPSKVMMDMGRNIVTGLELGIQSKNIGDMLTDAMNLEAFNLNLQTAMDTAAMTVRDGVDQINGSIEGLNTKDIIGNIALNSQMGNLSSRAQTTAMPAMATIANRTNNQELNITAQYQKVQSEASLRDDLALWNMMMRQQAQ